MRPVIVFGLGFGDEGKGRVVDALVRRLNVREVVRFGGGPQAAHRVVAPDGRAHVFAQLGSGLLVPGTRARIARGMLVDPLALVREADALAAVGVPGALGRLAVDPRCRIVTPLQKLVGQMRELARGARRHGSCGRGVGEAARDAVTLGDQAPTIGDLADVGRLTEKLRFLRHVKLDHAEQLAGAHGTVDGIRERLDRLRRLDARALAEELHTWLRSGVRVEPDAAIQAVLRRGEPVVFEGAQGLLLDSQYGFTPHVTATDTTPRPAESLLEELGTEPPLRLGVLRAYATRHGAGPFPSEDGALALADPHNVATPWQGPLRAGWPDLVLLRYAATAGGGVDGLAVTGLDRLHTLGALRAAEAYRIEDDCCALLQRDSHDPTRVIGLHASCDAGERARLTRALFTARPVWREAGTGDSLLELLASRDGAGAPVLLTAHGERAEATTWRGLELVHGRGPDGRATLDPQAFSSPC